MLEKSIIEYRFLNLARIVKYSTMFVRQYGVVFIKQKIKQKINIIFEKVNKPKVLQLPITYKCNYNCLMCGMREIVDKEDFQLKDLKKTLNNPLYKKIISVGINGGEPFLRDDIDKVVDVLLEELPNLKSISIISNGYCTEKIVEKLQIIKAHCAKKNIVVGMTLSLDGFGEINDIQRGMRGGFARTVETLNLLNLNKKMYCDNLSILCTITKYNVFYLSQLDEWARNHQYNINYNIATLNVRIHNEDRYDNFTLNNTELEKRMASEFLMGKYVETGEIKYWVLHMYLETGKRLASCEFQYDGVTLDAGLNLAYCATYSDNICNTLNKNSYKAYINSLCYRKELCRKNCNTCSHYCYDLGDKGFWTFYKYYIKTKTFPLL